MSRYDQAIGRLEADIQDSIRAYVGERIGMRQTSEHGDLIAFARVADEWFVTEMLKRLRRNWRFVERDRRQTTIG